jgi:carbon-monoxide dehydrogenase medium subunit
LLVLDALLVLARPGGRREIPIENFFLGANCSALEEDEILLEVRIPYSPAGAGTAFQKLRRQQTAVDMAVVNVATLLPQESGHSPGPRIALGSVGPTAFRPKRAEAVLAEGDLRDSRLREAARTAAEEARPLDDVRGTSSYRKKMVEVLVLRCLETSRERRV